MVIVRRFVRPWPWIWLILAYVFTQTDRFVKHLGSTALTASKNRSRLVPICRPLALSTAEIGPLSSQLLSSVSSENRCVLQDFARTLKLESLAQGPE